MSRTVTAIWFPDGSGAWIDDPEREGAIHVSIEHWYERGDRVGESAWVASFMVSSNIGPQRRRLEDGPAAPATEKARRTELAVLALDAASLDAADEPAPVVQEFGTPDDLLVRQIEMLHSGCGDAIRRVTEAALDESAW